MRNTKRWLALLLCLCLALTLFGCAKPAPAQDDPTPTPESPEPTPDAGENSNSLVVSIGAEAVYTDPTIVSSLDEMALLTPLFEGLMKWGPSGKRLDDDVEWAQVVPGMAESYDRTEEANGAVTYTFHLREAKWSDGKAVTAHDFVYAWQRLMNPSIGADYAELLGSVDQAYAVLAGVAQPTDLGVRAVDDSTFAVTLIQDDPWFLELCALPFTAPLRQDKIEEGGARWTYDAETYVTNGPYRLMAWEHDYMAMEKNPEYYGDAANQPDTLIYAFRSDDATDLSAFSAGSLDFLVGAVPQSGEVCWAPYPASYYLIFQTAQPPFDDPLVRQAFTLAVDRTRLVTDQVPGQVPAGSLVPPGISGPDGAAGADYRTRSKESFDPTATENNRNKAKALLSQAGYPDGKDFPAVTYLCPENTAHQAIGQALCEMWKEALGVEVTVEAVSWGDFLGRCHRGEFFMARGRWVADYDDPLVFLELWHSESQANDARYFQEQYDALLERAYRADSPSARMDLLSQAEDLLIGRDYVLAPLYYETTPYLKGDSLRGVCYTPQGFFVFTQSAKK